MILVLALSTEKKQNHFKIVFSRIGKLLRWLWHFKGKQLCHFLSAFLLSGVLVLKKRIRLFQVQILSFYNPFWFHYPGLEVIKTFSCSTQLSMKFQMLIKYLEIQLFSGPDKPRVLFFLLINVKMPRIVGSWTFMNRKKFHTQLIWAWYFLYNLWPGYQTGSHSCYNPL